MGKTVIFVDGENLTNRFHSDAQRRSGNLAMPNLEHFWPESFVWSPYLHSALNSHFPDARVFYFTSVWGDDTKLKDLKRAIKACGLVPHVRRKPKQAKTKGVDVALAVDAIDCAWQERPDTVVLLTGDGDFVPLAEKLQQRRVRVVVWALSGLSPELRDAADVCDERALWETLSMSLTPQGRMAVTLSGGESGGRSVEEDESWSIGSTKVFGGEVFRREPGGTFAVHVGWAR